MGPRAARLLSQFKTYITILGLALPNSKVLFIQDTDASDFAKGEEPMQVQEVEERVIAHGSFSLTREQQCYCRTRYELLAIVRFTKQFNHFLLGREVVVRTDFSSLTRLQNFKTQIVS